MRQMKGLSFIVIILVSLFMISPLWAQEANPTVTSLEPLQAANQESMLPGIVPPGADILLPIVPIPDIPMVEIPALEIVPPEIIVPTVPTVGVIPELPIPEIPTPAAFVPTIPIPEVPLPPEIPTRMVETPERAE